jgi:preprotein translocase subunit SecB
MAKPAKPTKTVATASKPAAKKSEPAAKPQAARAEVPAPAAPIAAGAADGAAAGGPPNIRILGQYLKDLSFENPNAPGSLAPQQSQPDINIAVNVNARNLGGSDFEVELHLDAKASSAGNVIFAADLLYAGIFRMERFPQNTVNPAVLIECPRILFPFARQIMADATRNGGFPPLMLDPIDFLAMYQQRMKQQSVGTA